MPVPGLDQKGFALWDANLVWRSPGNRWTIGLHGKNLTDKKYITSGYNFLLPEPVHRRVHRQLTAPATVRPAARLRPTLGREGVLTAFYGNPRQVFLSFGARF